MELVVKRGPRLRAGRAQQGRGRPGRHRSRSTRSSRRSLKVNFNVTNARVGQRTDYDRLVLEVWTDGSVRPEDALAYAARILQDQLAIFINFEEEAEIAEPLEEAIEGQLNENLFRPVDELELSVRSANCLQNADIKLHRRAGAADRAGDAQDQELRPQVAERDQGDPARDGLSASACASRTSRPARSSSAAACRRRRRRA